MKNNKLLLRLVGVLMFIIFSWSFNSFASCTLNYPESTKYITFGTVIVDPDAPIGSVLATEHTGAWQGGAKLVECNSGFTNRTELDYWKTMSNYGNKVYNTNLNGIGFKITSDGSSNAVPTDQVATAAGAVVVDGFSVQLIKTNSSFKTGVLTNERIMRGSIVNQFYYIDIALNGTNKIIAPSCSVNSSNINVSLGTWDTSELRGVGTKTSDVPINLRFSCPTSDVGITASVSASADPSQSGTLYITPGIGNASGVGIQMVNASGSPLTLNKDFVVTNSANSGTYNPGWKAHYIQTGSEVTPGRANATVTVTFNYN